MQSVFFAFFWWKAVYYRIVVSSFFVAHISFLQSAMDKNKEIRRLQNEGKVSFDEMRNAANRTEKLAYAVQGIQINVSTKIALAG